MSKLKFTIQGSKGNARAGTIELNGINVKTPIFMPVGTKATIKGIILNMLQDPFYIGTQIEPINLILANTYHLLLRPGSELVKQNGGLHKFENWPGLILTDSGGFQVFSLGLGKADGGRAKIENLEKKNEQGKINNEQGDIKISRYKDIKLFDNGKLIIDNEKKLCDTSCKNFVQLSEPKKSEIGDFFHHKITDSDLGLEENTVNDYKIRNRVSCVIYNQDGKIATLYSHTSNFYGLPGGGIDEGESEIQALHREVLEETGFGIKNIRKIGVIDDFRSKDGILQKTHQYIADFDKKIAEPNFVDYEKDLDIELQWKDLDEILKVLENINGNYIDKHMNQNMRLVFEYLKKTQNMGFSDEIVPPFAQEINQTIVRYDFLSDENYFEIIPKRRNDNSGLEKFETVRQITGGQCSKIFAINERYILKIHSQQRHFTNSINAKNVEYSPTIYKAFEFDESFQAPAGIHSLILGEDLSRLYYNLDKKEKDKIQNMIISSIKKNHQITKTGKHNTKHLIERLNRKYEKAKKSGNIPEKIKNITESKLKNYIPKTIYGQLSLVHGDLHIANMISKDEEIFFLDRDNSFRGPKFYDLRPIIECCFIPKSLVDDELENCYPDGYMINFLQKIQSDYGSLFDQNFQDEIEILCLISVLSKYYTDGVNNVKRANDMGNYIFQKIFEEKTIKYKKTQKMDFYNEKTDKKRTDHESVPTTNENQDCQNSPKSSEQFSGIQNNSPKSPKQPKPLVKITDDGVHFRSIHDGTKHFMSPESCIDTQSELGSDIMMMLDICSPAGISDKKYKQQLYLTHKRAERAYNYMETKYDDVRGVLFPIVQGGTNLELRKFSAETLSKYAKDGIAIGGVSVGESQEEVKRIVDFTTPLLPRDKPRYLMGVGNPKTMKTAIEAGIDMFDCVMPTRFGRHGLYYTDNGYEKIGNTKNKSDMSRLTDTCDCYACRSFTKSYIHHLFREGEMLGGILLSLHNIVRLMKYATRIRKEILE